MKKPSPKTVKQVCTLCGLDWGKHGESPTTDTCVSLLLDEVRALNAQLAHASRPIINQPIINQPIINPVYPQPWRPFPGPYWGTSSPLWISSPNTSGGSISSTTTLSQGLGQPQPRNVLS